MRGHEFGSTPQLAHSRTPSIDSRSEGVHYAVCMLLTTDSGLNKGWSIKQQAIFSSVYELMGFSSIYQHYFE